MLTLEEVKLHRVHLQQKKNTQKHNFQKVTYVNTWGFPLKSSNTSFTSLNLPHCFYVNYKTIAVVIFFELL